MKSSLSIITSFLLILLFSAQFTQASSSFTPRNSHQYCVVGAGAAGVQIAYLMNRYQNPKMDYVVLERNSRPGSFFETYPRQRKLISINKVYTGTNDQEFNLRHDWNSLLNHDDDLFFSAKNGEKEIENRTVLFKELSEEYYPSADLLPKYLDLFVQEHGPFNIAFDTDVVSIKRQQEQNQKRKNFLLELSTGKSLQCEVVILASGKSVERRFKIKEGSHLITGYSDAPTDPAKYKNQEILILGAGNSAFELAKAVESTTAFVHVASRNPIQPAYQDHYPGSVRAVNLGFLDRYQLKSMDVLMTLSTPDVRHGRLYYDKKLKRIMLRQEAGDDEEEAEKERRRKGRRVTEDGKDNNNNNENSRGDEFEMDSEEETKMESWAKERHENEMQELREKHENDRLDAEKKLVAAASKELFPSRRGYHRVISCLGFKLNSSMFSTKERREEEKEEEAEEGKGNKKKNSQTKAKTIQPLLDASESFLEVASNFESVNIENLFVAGALAHFRDFKRSAGGFIHGFRYTARTLVASLRERFQSVEFPFLEFTERNQVLSRIMWRLKNVSSLYQMQSQLCDAIVIIEEKGDGKGEKIKKKYRYYQDLPLDNLKSKTPILTALAPSAFSKTNLHFLTLSLEFGKDFQGVGTLHHQAQKENYKRRAEKMMWDPQQATADPDFRLHYSRANPSSRLPVLDKITAMDLKERDEHAHNLRAQRRGSRDDGVLRDGVVGSGYHPVSPGGTSLLQPLQKPPTMLPASEGKPPRLDRFLFLHPVLREWKRSPSSSSSSSSPPDTNHQQRHQEKQQQEQKNGKMETVKNQLVRELRLHEDVLNEFTQPIYHETPVRKMLDKVL